MPSATRRNAFLCPCSPNLLPKKSTTPSPNSKNGTRGSVGKCNLTTLGAIVLSAKKVYKVLVVGAGKRGKHHAQGFKNNPRFELAGLSGVSPERLAQAAAELGVRKTSLQPLALAKEIQPDVFCFCTPPAIRLDLI